MKLKPIVEILDAAPLYAPAGWEELGIEEVFASDLISDILVSEGENQVLLTSLTSPQVVRTAALVGAIAIVLVHRRQTPPGMVSAAKDQDMPLFRSTMPKYEACVKLGRIQEAGA